MLFKKLAFLNFSLFFLYYGELFASNFFIYISNDSANKYEQLDITIFAENFNANYGRITIENINPYSALKNEVEEHELNTPLMYYGGEPGDASNLKILINAKLKGKRIVSREFFSVLNDQNKKRTYCHGGIGLQVPNMDIVIDESGKINVTFL